MRQSYIYMYFFIPLQLDSWSDVRYKMHQNNKKCYRDKSNNILCNYLALVWDSA